LDENSVSTGFLPSLVDYQQELNKAYKKAYQNVKDKKESDVHKMFLKIPDAKKMRLYLAAGGVLPQDEAHLACPFCGHKYVDGPATNTGTLSKGLLITNQRALLVRAFKRAKERSQLPLIHNGKSYTRYPATPKMPVVLKELIFRYSGNLIKIL
jgi:hypothetical protein